MVGQQSTASTTSPTSLLRSSKVSRAHCLGAHAARRYICVTWYVFLPNIATHLCPPRKIPHYQEFKFEGLQSKKQLSDQFDWRKQGVIGDIRDQQQVHTTAQSLITEPIWLPGVWRIPPPVVRLDISGNTVEPLNSGRVGTRHFVHYREVFLEE